MCHDPGIESLWSWILVESCSVISDIRELTKALIDTASPGPNGYVVCSGYNLSAVEALRITD